MVKRKARGKSEAGEVVPTYAALTKAQRQAVDDLAQTERRSVAAMISVLVDEALAARKSARTS